MPIPAPPAIAATVRYGSILSKEERNIEPE